MATAGNRLRSRPRQPLILEEDSAASASAAAPSKRPRLGVEVMPRHPSSKLVRVGPWKNVAAPTRTGESPLARLLSEVPWEDAFLTTYRVDVPWLLTQFPTSSRTPNKPWTLMVGHTSSWQRVSREPKSAFPKEARIVGPPALLSRGILHSKLMLLLCASEILVAIGTGDLTPEDSNDRLNLLWTQRFPRLDTSQNADSVKLHSPVDSFGRTLMAYVHALGFPEWAQRLGAYCYADAEASLVASVPNSALPAWTEHSGGKVGLDRVAELTGELEPGPSLRTLTCQVSSIAEWPDVWLQQSVQESFLVSEIAIVWPSKESLRLNPQGYAAAPAFASCERCLSRDAVRSRLRKYQCPKDVCAGSLSHVSVYFIHEPRQIESPCAVLLTSANLSRAAWGDAANDPPRNFELGVFLSSANLNYRRSSSAQQESFPVPFATPLTSFNDSEEPWISDRTYDECDLKGIRYRYHTTQ